MSYCIDQETCVSCGDCVSECPREAISENGGVFTIDPNRCNDCGVCAPACPVGAIAPCKDKP
ncbi:MAG: 4Fe-4S binding protein [Candidatus Marinimicrobia bacterium]|jgi:ferredoxin|nr:4Fe-4S binding protein [Candidatus Neomarinimicrobiota bacterium]